MTSQLEEDRHDQQLEEDRRADLIELTNREAAHLVKEESIPRMMAKLRATAIVYYQGGFDDAIKWMQLQLPKIRKEEREKVLKEFS